MKRWEYSKGWKAFAFILNQVCAVVLVLSVAVCTLAGSNGFAGLGSEASFESTAYYQQEVSNQIYRCVRAASRESKFENSGVYDTRLEVNVTQYAADGTISGTADSADGGLYYRLVDLLNWSLDGFEVDTMMKITYDNGSVGYLRRGSADYTEQSFYGEDASISSYSSMTYGDTSAEEDAEAATEEAMTEDAAEAAEVTEEAAEESSEETAEASEAGSAADADSAEDADVVSEETVILESDEDGYWEEFIANEDAENLEDWELYGAGQGIVQDVEQLDAVAERYQPVGYESIPAYAQEQGISTEELQNLYYDLENSLAAIYDDYYAYKENLNLFSPSMTNMRYLVIPKSVTEITPEDFDQKIYTNFKSFSNASFTTRDGLLDYIKSFDSYVIYDSTNMDFQEQNMPVSLSDLSSYTESYQPSVDGGYILAIAIDPEYKASDSLQQYKQQYDKIRPVSRMAIYGTALGALLYLLTLVYLTVAAGRTTTGEQEIRLNSFDRIHSELAALILIVPAAALLLCLFNMTFRSLSMMEFVAVCGGATLSLNVLFVIGYLSLVRRVKARTLWTNSVVCRLIAGVQAMLRGWTTTARTLLSYLCFLLVNFVLIVFNYFGLQGLLAAILFDAAVGVVLLRQAAQRQKILDGIAQISGGNLTYQIPTDSLSGDSLSFAEAVNQAGEGMAAATEKSLKDERLKSDLITNVSHDIKTPLTSIINYVDLLKREEIENERARNYIAILEDKAQRLKHLTEDLVEASKISSGNIRLELTRLNFQELICQMNGEFSERFEAKGLSFVVGLPEEPVVIEADGRRLWRIMENLYTNAAKYAMPNTRVYIDLTLADHMARFSMKNISEQPLNIGADELTERFIRGDVSRSTEGSGLGLSIARSLTEIQKGSFDIYLDGDLFKVTVIFPEAEEKAGESGEMA